MKKITLALILGLAISLTACGSSTDTNNNVEDIATESVEEDVDAEINEEIDDTEEVEDTDTDEEAGVEDAESSDADDSDSVETVAIADIFAEIESSVELVSPMQPNSDFIYNYYGIDISSVEEYVFSISEDPTSAETIIIVNAGEGGDVKTMEINLDVVKGDKAVEMENYLPEEFEVVNNGILETRGNYVILVISHNVDDIMAVIDQYIPGE